MPRSTPAPRPPAGRARRGKADGQRMNGQTDRRTGPRRVYLGRPHGSQRGGPHVRQAGRKSPQLRADVRSGHAPRGAGASERNHRRRRRLLGLQLPSVQLHQVCQKPLRRGRGSAGCACGGKAGGYVWGGKGSERPAPDLGVALVRRLRVVRSVRQNLGALRQKQRLLLVQPHQAVPLLCRALRTQGSRSSASGVTRQPPGGARQGGPPAAGPGRACRRPNKPRVWPAPSASTESRSALRAAARLAPRLRRAPRAPRWKPAFAATVSPFPPPFLALPSAPAAEVV